MKPYILFLSALLFITTESIAQLPDGSVAPDFTITDLDGNQHKLYDLLDDGYSVVIDLNATWCNPCWNYHIGGALEELWESHGPAGGNSVNANSTNDVYVFMIESQSTNTLEQLYGTVGTSGNAYADNTAGDWVTGTSFPIADDAAVADLYDLQYFPTIFTICPNRIVTESGQISADAHYDLITNCAQQTPGENAAILNVQNTINTEGCDATATGTISAVIQNMGTETLESFSVDVIEDGEVLASETFNGSLETYATTTINFGSITINSNSVDIVITSSDENAADNSLTQEFIFSSAQSSQQVTVNLLTDNFGNETYMQITDENDNVIWFEGNEAVAGTVGTGQLAPTDLTNPLGDNQLYEWDVTLPSTGCFKFEITDYYGDGLAASTNTNGGVDGDWNIEDNNGVIIAQQTVQNFENEDNTFFENTEAGTSSIGENEKVSFSIYPNPVNSNATLEVNLSENSNVQLDIVNVLGEVTLSESHNMNSGNNSININVSQLTSGIYFAHLTVNGETNTTKITVTK